MSFSIDILEYDRPRIGVTTPDFQELQRKKKIDLLIRQSTERLRLAPQEALRQAMEARMLSIELSDKKREAESLIALARVQYALAKFRDVQMNTSGALDLLKEMTEPGIEEMAIELAAQNEYRLGNYKKTIKYASTLYAVRKKQCDLGGLERVLQLLITAHHQLSEYAVSLKYIFEYLHGRNVDEAVSAGSEQCIGDLLLANHYTATGSWQRAKELYWQCIPEIWDEDATSYSIKAALQLALLESSGDNVELAIRLCEDIEQLLAARVDEELPIQHAVVASKVYLKAGDLERAKTYLATADMIDTVIQFPLYTPQRFLVKAEIAMRLDDPSIALQHYQSALGSSTSLGLLPERVEALEGIAACYRSLGQQGMAFDYLTALLHTKAELVSRQTSEHLREIERKHLLAQEERKLATLREQSDENQRELISSSLKIQEYQQTVQELKQVLLQETDGVTMPPVRAALLRKIEASIDGNEQPVPAEDQLLHSHGPYMKRLADQYPALTMTELKVSALIKMNYTTKRIAQVMHLSILTVDTHRKRIRSKFGISSSANLCLFLNRI